MATASAPTEFALLREQLGLDIAGAALEFNVPPEVVLAWEAGQSRVPDRIIRTLGVLADFTPPILLPGRDALERCADREPEQPALIPPRKRQAQLGQFMTPASVAGFMAKLFNAPFPDEVRLLDAGAGRAALTQAFVAHWRANGGQCLTAHAYEADATILPDLHASLSALNGEGVEARVIEGDFIAATAMAVRSGTAPRYTHALLNPPYRKIGSNSSERRHLRVAGLETVNLYSGFVWLALQMLEKGGELVAIIPRSFCNGPYYAPFRRSLLRDAAIVRMHLFGSRDQAFRHDKVLQENIILHVRRGVEQQDVLVSTSRDDRFSDCRERRVEFNRIVFPDDDAQFIHVPTEEDDDGLAFSSFRCSLEEIGMEVSTGPVVDFRLKAHLRADPGADTVPLLYPGHFVDGELCWPRPGFKKANAIARNQDTERWLYPGGCYTLVRRFSAKEERRRIVANVVEPGLSAEMLGFENHLNVFHQRRRPLPEHLARGLATFLNSTVVDRWFRRFNGHTQVNATDLRTMRYPNQAQIKSLGRWAAQAGRPSQEAIDQEVGRLG